jgi:hypothetical protein
MKFTATFTVAEFVELEVLVAIRLADTSKALAAFPANPALIEAHQRAQSVADALSRYGVQNAAA